MGLVVPVVPSLAVLALSVRMAHLATGSAYSAPAKVPWAVFLWGDYRHPSQAYEILAGAGILLILWRARKSSRFLGSLFLLWLTLTSAARLFLEAFRSDSTLILGGLLSAQVAVLA